MRISDWSSDVCSSDLAQPPFRSSRLIGAERQPTSDCRQSLQQSLLMLPSGNLSILILSPGCTPRCCMNSLRSVICPLEVKVYAFIAALLRPKFVRGNHLKVRSEEHTSELQSLMRISYAVFCLKK